VGWWTWTQQRWTASPSARDELGALIVADDDEVDCNRALVQLYQFLDGELTHERRQRIELHLNGCQHCFSSFDFEQELRIVVRSKLQTEVPQGLVQRIVAVLELERRGLNRPANG
jgi:anti-sigma factor (TIGR02949 family)